MMSYLKKHNLTLTLLLAAFVLVPQITHAQLSTIAGFAFDLTGGLLSPIAVGIVKLVSYITMLSGVVLNASVYYTVINMADSLSTDNLPALEVAWTTVRDLANMGFIFMLLYASIMTIVGKEKDARGIVVKMVIAAILINFSLFFTKVIIDVANLLALTFYSAIAPGAVGPNTFLSAGLSNNIIQALGAQTLWQSAGELDGSTVFIAAIMSSITLLVTAFVFAAMAVMFLVRYVVLIFVLILSPLMVLSSVFPALNDYSKKWWDALLNQAFFAPVFFILMWVTLTLITGISQSIFGSSSSLSGALNASSFNAGGVSMLINYAVILGFVVATLVISKSIADKASPMAASLNKWALGAAGGAGFGLAGFAGRRTIGAGGTAIADSERLKRAEEEGGFKGAAARLALAAGRKTSKASFDVRASDTYGKISERTGVEFGKAGGKGGFEQIVKDTAKREKEQAELLKPSDLVVNKAERELDRVKKLNASDTQNERIERRSELQDTIDDLAVRRGNAVNRGATTEELSAIDEEISRAQEDFDATTDAVTYKKYITKKAQAKVDELKGVSEDEARKRRIEEIRIRDGSNEKDAKETLKVEENLRFQKIQELKAGGMSESDAKKEAKRLGVGWAPEEIKSAGNKRKETYAARLENPNLKDAGLVKNTWLNKVVFVSRGNKQAAMEIRKSIKEKKPADKLVEELSRARESGEGGGSGTTQTNAPTPPAGGAGPAPTTPTP